MRKIKRILSVALSFMLIVQMVPMNFWALSAQSNYKYKDEYIELTTENVASEKTETVDSTNGQIITLPVHQLVVNVRDRKSVV